MGCEQQKLKIIKNNIKSKYFLLMFSVVSIFIIFSNITPAFAVARICVGPVAPSSVCGDPSLCVNMEDGTVIFPSGTKAPVGGQLWNSINSYPIPTSDLTFTSRDCNFDLAPDIDYDFPPVTVAPLQPSSGLPSPYGAGPYYATTIPSSNLAFRNTHANNLGEVGARPDSSLGLPWHGPTGIDNGPTIIVVEPTGGAFPFEDSSGTTYPSGGDPMGLSWNRNISCFYCVSNLLKEPFDVRFTDPIVFLPDGEAMMVPMGTMVVRSTGAVAWPDPGMDGDDTDTRSGPLNGVPDGIDGNPATPGDECTSNILPPEPKCQTMAGGIVVLSLMGDSPTAGKNVSSVLLLPGDIIVPPEFDPLTTTTTLLWDDPCAITPAPCDTIPTWVIDLSTGLPLLDGGGNRIQAENITGGTPYLGSPAIQYLGGGVEIPWTLEEVRYLQIPWNARNCLGGGSGCTAIPNPPFSGGPGSGSGIGNNLPPICTIDPTDALLTIAAGGDPIATNFIEACLDATVDNALLVFDTSASSGQNAYIDYEGGEQFREDMFNWFINEFEPAMKDMTVQLNVAVIDQSRSLGSMHDGGIQTKTQNVIQKKEIEAIKRLRPSENMCAMATVTTGMQTSLQTSRVIKDAINTQSAARALNLPGTITEHGADTYNDIRWTKYCDIFVNPSDNAGYSGCPGAGLMPGADINVERFLFQDTIDMTNENERMAADTILMNLVDSKILEPLPPNFDSASARHIKLKRDHYAGLRQPLIDVVGGIIGRRTGIPRIQLDAGAQLSLGGIGMAVRDIRTQAGIPIAETSLDPSYNEMMLARSKEYFFNVDKILQTGNNIGTIRQELVVNESLIAVILQDIEELERQINAVLMTQAAMKLNKNENAGISKNIKLIPKSRQ